jgi:predicted metalloendopeptidase
MKHLTRMFRLLGDNAATAERNARTVMRLATRFARASMPLTETSEPRSATR